MSRENSKVDILGEKKRQIEISLCVLDLFKQIWAHLKAYRYLNNMCTNLKFCMHVLAVVDAFDWFLFRKFSDFCIYIASFLQSWEKQQKKIFCEEKDKVRYVCV